jgi:hypothetical protein
MKNLSRTIALSLFIIISCKGKREVPVYEVNYVNNNCIYVDGISDEDAWKKAVKIRNFLLPWGNNTPQVTTFRHI